MNRSLRTARRILRSFYPARSIPEPGGRWLRAGRRVHAAVLEAVEGRRLLAATLDPEFNGSGISLADFALADDFAYATHVMPDGRVLVAGFAGGAGTGADFGVVRFLKNGTLDTSFGNNGLVRVDFGSSHDKAYSVAMDDAGHILLAGTARQGASAGGFNFAVARLNTDGSLDTTFGDLAPDGSGRTGKVATDFGGGFDQAYALAVHGGGIVVAGTAGTQFALVRYRENGTLDTNFGVSGRVSTYLSDSGSEAYTLAVTGSGKIVAGGYAYFDDGTESNLALARYNADGSLDTSFGVGGVVTEDFGGYDDAARSVAIGADGSVYVAGYTNDDMLVARYTMHGKLDGTFGQGGAVRVDFHEESDGAFHVKVCDDGNVLVAGHVEENNDRDFMVMRLRSDGSFDETFAPGGKFRQDFGSVDDSAQAVATDARGNVVVVGFSAAGAAGAGTGGGHDFAVMRLRLNQAPVADPGSGYTVKEGSGVTLSGAGSSDADGSVVSYAWDFDGDGVADATGAEVNFSAAGLDDGVYVVRLTVTDDQGATHSASTSVTVQNVMPSVTFATTYGTVTGQAVTFAGGFTDPGALDTHQVMWNFGDGTVVNFHSTSDPGALDVRHVYTTPGTYTITMTVLDDDGASMAFSRTITVGAIGLQPDPNDPTKTALVVGGTTGDDKIQLVGTGRGYMVFVNNQFQGRFEPTGSLLVYGNGGNDKVQVVGNSKLPVQVTGGTDTKPKKTSALQALADLLTPAKGKKAA